MSWGITALGKPSEVGAKVATALLPSRSQSNHAAIFNAIEQVVSAAVAGMHDEDVSETWSRRMTVLVESNGHVDSNSAQATLAIRTIYENGPGKAAEQPK